MLSAASSYRSGGVANACRKQASRRSGPGCHAFATKSGELTTASSRRTRATHCTRASSAPISQVSSGTTPEELFKKADYFAHNNGFFGPLTPQARDMMDDTEFVFRGIVIGPFTKQAFIDSLETAQVYSAFPDLKPNPFGFCIDPEDPLRVFFYIRQTGTMTEDWELAGTTLKATGGKMQTGPASCNMIFTPEGKVKYLGIGYIADRIVSDQYGGTTNVAMYEALRVANAPNPGWLFSDGVLQSVARGAVAAATEAAGKPELSPARAGENLPAWFKALPNSNLRNGEGM